MAKKIADVRAERDGLQEQLTEMTVDLARMIELGTGIELDHSDDE